tara:strand:- start:409 stop:591 length:183 start_codon:yes stop_codon:yes gene_type:complete
MKTERLHNFLVDDLKKLEYHIARLIDYTYDTQINKEYKEDIEEIEHFFSYWTQHINKLNK